MIKEKEIVVKASGRLYPSLKEKGYDVKFNKEILVKIEDLSKESHILITAICDICLEEKVLRLYKYYSNFDRFNFYSCRKCSGKKKSNSQIKDKPNYDFNDGSFDGFCEKHGIYKTNSDINRLRKDRYHVELCTICNPIKSFSGGEEDLYNFIGTIYSGEIIRNYRRLGKEIDIFLPELNIGFEYNGTYYHSIQRKDKKYHFDKTIFFLNKGINLFHIWEHDWKKTNEYIKNKINDTINGIYILNQNNIYNLDYFDMKILNDYDILGFVNPEKIIIDDFEIYNSGKIILTKKSLFITK